ncbi:MAG: acyl-CoA dehydratase activase-related protein [Candidatus Atribacteria bacterium]|nr:acyl-CoA dehydratase activase-related protein [Candidatus Atribacteria bacterium]
MKVGIPRGLLFNDFSPLFIPFFKYLGIKTVISDETNRKIINRGLEIVPAEYCFPTKVAYGHVDNLLKKLKKDDFIFIPHIASTGEPTGSYKYCVTCPWTQSAPDLMKSALKLAKEGLNLENLVSPSLFFDWGLNHIEDQMKKALAKMGYSTKNVRAALQEGLINKERFDKKIEEKTKEVFDSIKKYKKNEPAFLVMARPYTSYDANVNNNIVNKILDAGYLAIPLEFAPIGSIDISKQMPKMYWIQGQKKLAAIELLNKNKNLFGIDITYFACGPDTQINQQMRCRTQKPFLTVEMDEHTGDAGIDTRLQAFFNTVKSYLGIEAKQTSKVFSVKLKGLDKIKDKKILVFPPMSKHNYAVSAVFNAYRIQSRVSEISPDETMERARSCTYGLVCTPYLHTTEAMLNFMQKPGFDQEKFAFFQATSDCGPCRLGQYASLESLLFQKKGIDVDIITGGEVGSEFSLGMPLLIKAWSGITAVDQLEKMRMHTRPYEVNKGTSDQIYEKYMKRLLDHLADPKTNLGKMKTYLTIGKVFFSNLFDGNSSPIEEILRKAQGEFSQVKRTSEEKPKIGMIGEFFVRLHEPANQNILRKLEEKGAETWLAPAAEYLTYSYYLSSVFAREKFSLNRKKENLREWILKSILYRFMIGYEHMLFKATLPYMQGFADISAQEIVSNGEKYIRHYIGGEAIVSMGKAVDYVKRGLDGIISVIPFNCMPGLTVAGFIPKFRKDNNNIPFVSIEYDGFQDSTREMRIDTFVAQVKERYENKKYTKFH